MSAPPLPLSPALRKATGAYYTPAPLAQLLLDHALAPLLDSPAGQSLRVLDPACGAGDLLTAVHDRASARGRPASIVGVDIDPAAVAACQSALPAADLYTADALLDPPAPLRATGAFDLVVGNPPYVNAIERHFDPDLKRRLRDRYPAVRGPADLAHFFLHRAVDWVRPGGRLALVLPRSVLNSPAARHTRANLPPHLRPNLIYAPDRCDFFPGAAVFACLLVLGPDDQCAVSTDLDPARATFRTVPVAGDNWWQVVTGTPAPRTPGGPTVADRFSVNASMTAADAYDLLPHLVDDPSGLGPKLITTGLIEPRESRWGRKRCRYLKRDFTHPRVRTDTVLTPSLAARIANARRPKLLVAGLARRIEALLDATGESVGAVGTFSIFHPADDVAALKQLLDHLLSPAPTRHLIDHLGANAMRGRHITLKREFLRSLPLNLPLDN